VDSIPSTGGGSGGEGNAILTSYCLKIFLLPSLDIIEC
jgi:hypothetical protein